MDRKSQQAQSFSFLEDLPGWCSSSKAEVLFHLVAGRALTRCVEIGVYAGRSLLPIGLALKSLGKGRVTGIDTWDVRETWVDDRFRPQVDPNWSQETLDRCFSILLDQLLKYDLVPHVRLLCGHSSQLSTLWQAGELDLVHVDGTHTAAQSLLDVTRYVPLVRPGGFVVLDDTDWTSLSGAVEFTEQRCKVFHQDANWSVYQKHE